MESPSARVKPQRRQQVRQRLFWFVAGAGASYLLISTPFHWLQRHTSLPIPVISACSTAVGTSFFFVWNYFVNFRTGLRKREALPRYLAAVGIMWVLSSATLSLLKHYQANFALNLFGHALDLDVIATQFLLAGLKFPLYHKWAFPLPKEREAEAGIP